MKGNPWAFGLFFILLVCFIVWNGFQIPTVFWGETETTKGVIIDNKAVPFIGKNYRQMITYQYLAGDSIYTNRIKLGGRDKMKYVGTKVDVQFDPQNPGKNRIEKYFHAVKPIATTHIWNDSLEYEKLLFLNDIVFVEKRTIKNELIFSEALEYVLVDDYVILVPLFHGERKEQKVLRRFDIEVDQFEKETLIERGTGKIFK